MSEIPHDPDEPMAFPPVTVDGMIVGAEMADEVSSAFGERLGRSLSVDERAAILEDLLPGASYFYELAKAAGELAGSGDPLGALALLGGEEEARAMVGDEEVDLLIAEATDQITPPRNPSDN